MADIEFVIEAPQVSRTHKKRPRLVTSCDHCRVKKIKCVQHPATGTCEACLAANLPCLYRDREQYFAERTRMLSGAGPALRDASTDAQSRAHLSAINASTPTPSRGSSPPQSSHSSGSSSDRSNSPSYFSFMGVGSLESTPLPVFNSGLSAPTAHPTWDGPIETLSWTPRRPIIDAHIDMDFSVSDTPRDFAPLLGLFDAHDSSQPHPNLMMSFLHVFFDKLGSTYPFLLSEIVCERFLHRQLPPLLANAIAASAARFSTLPEIVHIGPANACDVYCQIAKGLVPPDNTPATIDTLHAVMLLAWAEFKRGRQVMFNVYARIVPRLAAELGISDDTLPQLMQLTDAQGMRLLHTTWEGIQLLERTLLASELVALSTGTLQTAPRRLHHSNVSAPGPIRSSMW
ncbi:hypothetical protein K466DRAFT_486792 [Polyporus arcularius HHB13444]|uniref:Zn(2)-C6 fungal-type domain-containing protein n=1 Tax=Polyporus arcularius HHB13444 TaxID=1314778 RepID=A0A5C3PML7_9APHY|nr:hypothetical protein K466DRAFT_486792 [Polyporus arcularius HHB13444]